MCVLLAYVHVRIYEYVVVKRVHWIGGGGVLRKKEAGQYPECVAKYARVAPLP